jgi:hypothetical protein
MNPELAVDLRGAFDLHLHASPSLFPRLAADREVAEAAWHAGLAGILLKSHHESTVARAAALDGQFPGLRVFGGIVLNQHVGGLNPQAVRRVLQGGAQQVWLPTIDAVQHARVFGGTGGFEVKPRASATKAGVELMRAGKLAPELETILALIAEHDAILGTAHQSYEELRVIIPAAREAGVKKILLTHPFFVVPDLSLEQTMELVGSGGVAEFTYCTVSPLWACAAVENVAKAIQELGAENCILTSDAGQPQNPMPPEALRIFAQELLRCGVTHDDLDILLRRNPARMLGMRSDANGAG